MGIFDPKSSELQNGGYSWAYEVVDGARRYEVRSGDQWRYDNSVKERSETATYTKVDYGQTATLSYKFLIEPGAKNTADWLLLGQFHQTEDAGEMGVSPPFAIELIGDKMAIAVRDTTQSITKVWPNSKYVYKDTADIQRDHWYDIKIEIKFDPYGGGVLKVWRDGVQIVDYKGPLGYVDQVGPYWKEGIYRESANETMAVEFKDLVFNGVASGSPVDPTPSTASKPPPVVVDPTPAPDPTPDPTPVPTTGVTLNGANSADTLTGGAGHDVLNGGGGNDVLHGGAGNDLLNGGIGADKMYGGAGDDTYNVDNIGDLVVETAGAGTDTVNATFSYTLPDHVENLNLLGSASINGTGNALDNVVNGNNSANVINGGAGNDTLRGNGGNDTILGGDGADYLSGGAGNDVLTGGMGKDTLYGGAGADKFVYEFVSQSNGSAGVDLIGDFSSKEGDKIVLTAIDANVNAGGDQAFAFIGTSAFHKTAGELRYEKAGDLLNVYGDTNGDGVADLHIQVQGVASLSAGDFLL